ncbi:MAG TPA: TIGR03118 family protein [Terriglobales bacterium]|nr:TIGR03118 family protein [Terriglobales bacterium]
MLQPPKSKSTTLVLSLITFLCVLSATAFGQHFNRTDLTSDPASGLSTPQHDALLLNAWGLTRSSGSFWWVADNGSGWSTLYDGMGVPSPVMPQPLQVVIPPPKGQEGPSTPTGTVFNFTNAFNVAPKLKAFFIFVTEDGTVSAWNPGFDPIHARLKVNNAGNAIYKGVAIAQTTQGARLYATNFKTGQVEVFNGAFHPVAMPPSAFVDDTLPANYAPFGIQNVGGNIVVTFARREPGSTDEDHGRGFGYVTIFDTNGMVIARLAHGGYFNAPWGIAMSGADFGVFSHRLLIGNFGDGRIHAFNPLTGKFVGTLLDASGADIAIDGLWALEFGGGNANSGAANELFFTAGPNDESNGLLGKLSAVGAEQRGSSE